MREGGGQPCPAQHAHATHAALACLLLDCHAVQVDCGVGQISKKADDSPTSSASDLLPEQAQQFVASRSPSAQQFVQLILECWSDKRHGVDWLLLPERPPSKYLLALLALHSFDATDNTGGSVDGYGGGWVLSYIICTALTPLGTPVDGSVRACLRGRGGRAWVCPGGVGPWVGE